MPPHLYPVALSRENSKEPLIKAEWAQKPLVRMNSAAGLCGG
jgi:hypothetical protein